MLRKIGIDLLGIILIILAIGLGWLPGPGGVPLLIAGLGLLSINHEWARRWVKKVEKHGLNLSEKIFRDHRVWKISLDIAGILALGSGIWVFATATRNLLYAAASFLSCLGLVLLLGNRKRLKRVAAKFKAQA